MMKEKRKILKVGNSYAITIPRIWLKLNKLKAGDVLEIVVDKKLLQIKKEKAGSRPA